MIRVVQLDLLAGIERSHILIGGCVRIDVQRDDLRGEQLLTRRSLLLRRSDGDLNLFGKLREPLLECGFSVRSFDLEDPSHQGFVFHRVSATVGTGRGDGFRKDHH